MCKQTPPPATMAPLEGASIAQEQKKRVSFCDTPEYVERNELQPVTKAQAKKFWYRKKDFSRFKNENFETVVAAKNDLLDEEVHCVRGLERSIYFPPEKRRLDRLKLIQTVLEEQEHQKERGVYEPVAIKTISSICSQWERDQALRMAAADAFYATNLFEELVDLHATKHTIAVFEPPVPESQGSTDSSCLVSQSTFRTVKEMRKRSRSQLDYGLRCRTPSRATALRARRIENYGPKRLYWHTVATA